MKLLGSTKKGVDQDKDGEDVPKLEHDEVYEQASEVFFTFAPSKQFGQFINIAPHPLIMINTTN